MPKIGDTYRDHQQKTGQLMNQFKISWLFYSFAFVPSQVSGGKLDPNQISNFTILMPKNLKWAMAKCKYVKTKLQAYESAVEAARILKMEPKFYKVGT